MQNRLLKTFFYSSAALLLLTAAAKLYSATGTARILTVVDPLIHLRYRTIMVGVGLLELGIALYLLVGRTPGWKPWVVFWLSSNFVIYRLANDLLHIRLCPCLGTIASTLPISKGLVDFLLVASVLYLFFGSTYLVLSDWSRRLGRSNGAASETSVARNVQSVT